VAFVGAGFSMACGMPGWSKLLNSLLLAAKNGTTTATGSDHIKAVEMALKRSNLALAASLVREVLPSTEIDAAIQSQFDFSKYRSSSILMRNRMTARMRHLVTSPWAGIITTNYDQLIEHAIGKWTDFEINQTSASDSRLGAILANSEASPFFVKLHGSTSASQIVLTTEEYDRTYLCSPQITAFLTAVMLHYHLVFIGCSLEDEIVRLRRKLTMDFLGAIPMSYALLPASGDNLTRSQWLRKHAQIECLLYPANDVEHQSVDQFLSGTSKANRVVRVDRNVLSTSVTQISKQPLLERLNLVGSINLSLLKWIANAPNGIPTSAILDPFVNGSVPPSMVESISPEERVYRILFLVSVGLVSEVDHPRSSSSYNVPARVRQHLGRGVTT
jgi:hypothetical protein